MAQSQAILDCTTAKKQHGAQLPETFKNQEEEEEKEGEGKEEGEEGGGGGGREGGGGGGADEGAWAQATGVPHRAPCCSVAPSSSNMADDQAKGAVQ